MTDHIECYYCGRSVPEPETVSMQCFDCQMEEEGYESSLWVGMTVDPDTNESSDIAVRAYTEEHATDIIKMARPSHKMAGWPVMVSR